MHMKAASSSEFWNHWPEHHEHVDTFNFAPKYCMLFSLFALYKCFKFPLTNSIEQDPWETTQLLRVSHAFPGTHMFIAVYMNVYPQS